MSQNENDNENDIDYEKDNYDFGSCCVGRSAHDTQVSGADSLISCSSNKITTADVQIVDNEIIYNGSSYSGQVWSLDEKSMAFEISDGRLVKMTGFYENGNPAVIGTSSINGARKRRRKEFLYYDINGYEMTEREFERKYDNIIEKLTIIWNEEFPIDFA